MNDITKTSADIFAIAILRVTFLHFACQATSEKKINEIIKIHEFIGENNSWKELDEASKIIELKRIIETNLSAYENKNFLENLKIYNYDDVFKENALILSIEQPKLKDKIFVDNKIMFINYQNSLMKY